tara:strand:+ start:415 stop:951 length:537 start_codon:yes stop_codon:yes gene_type:complete
MKVFIVVSLFSYLGFMANTHILYDFTHESHADWKIVNDGVMGGLSNGTFSVDENGYGIFSGKVSLANNGGFTSIRHAVDYDLSKSDHKIVLKLKGDGKRYQFRIKQNIQDRHSYIQYFQTNNSWQEIELDLNDFYASWRGQKLELPNFEAQTIEECSFLIANNKEEDFCLILDYIAIK